MHRSGHRDPFARDRLPPPETWPTFLLNDARFAYPERLNITTALLDVHVAAGHGAAPCLIAPDGTTWSYAETLARVEALARALTDDLGLVPGERVLLRGANSPMMAAAFLAVVRAGGIAVPTMPMLRARELAYPLRKAAVTLALCQADLADELEAARVAVPGLERIALWSTAADRGLDALITRHLGRPFPPCDTASDDVCLIGFTSGTTGEPKGTMHFQRDLLAICDAYAAEVLRPQASDRFIGSPPLAFTFGLGGLLLFPLHVGASTVLIDQAAPDRLLAAIAQHRATIVFTAPTAYRAMLAKRGDHDLSSLRRCVSAGEALPAATFHAWKDATGLPLMDGIGATEMLHIFIAAPPERLRPGSTGLPVPGYEARVIDGEGREVPDGTAGRLAVRGPTGCRYLDDPRQTQYVQGGWNITGDTYIRDADGYFWYQARSDDMIVSSGYNIAGPEVEACLLTHPAVAECGVVGQPDAERGMIVKAYVVLRPGHHGDASMERSLQEFVKSTIAPYKYPRAIAFVSALPRTNTGKLQRFALRQMAEAEARRNDGGADAALRRAS